VGVLGLDHVQLAAPRGCEDEARRFFGENLGLMELDKPEALRARGGVWFAVGRQQLHALADARRFYTRDPWGNRLELLAFM
jgi:catechol 2,3-dioxygenase-like lactoylglutathione lyase family enzyme